MANTVVNPTIYAKKTQTFLRSSLVAQEIAKSQFKSDLYPGKTINFPYATTVRLQNYSYSTDLTIDPTVFTSNTYSIDQVKAGTANFDPLQNLVNADMNPENAISEELGYQLQRNIDQYVFNTGIGGALNTVAGGGLSASNMFEALGTVNATLTRARARAGTRFYVTDANGVAILANTDKANGFQLADSSLRNGFVGTTSAGFKVLVSNDLPYSVALTIDTIPTAGDTMAIAGKTWTWRAAGQAVLPGEISITNGNLGACQVSLLQAVNGTGAVGAANYIDLAVDDRRELQQMQLVAGAFGANVSAITAFGKMSPTETYTAVTNVFGTETVSYLLGVMGAIDLTIQAEPDIIVRDEPKNKSHNIIGTCQYGAGVFYRDKASLVKLTANA